LNCPNKFMDGTPFQNPTTSPKNNTQERTNESVRFET